MLRTVSNYYYSTQYWIYVLSRKIEFVSVKIENKKLAAELEMACDKNDGFLTYSQYLHIDQYGENGFYANSGKTGRTNANKRWGEAISRYCSDNNFNEVIEFGCGEGELGVTAVSDFRKRTSHDILWVGIEINKALHRVITNKFARAKFPESTYRIRSSLLKTDFTRKAVVVFPYSLDSISPEIFLNIDETISYPNALLGITVKDGYLHEIIIPQKFLQKRNISFAHGLFTSSDGIVYDLTSWKLRKGQRAYIAIDAFRILKEYASWMQPGSVLIVIDEFRTNPSIFNLGFFGVPKSLYERQVECIHLKRYYKQAGSHSFNFPIYMGTMFKFLHFLGFRSIRCDIEQKMAADLSHRNWITIRSDYASYSFLAKDKITKNYSIVPVPFSLRKLI